MSQLRGPCGWHHNIEWRFIRTYNKKNKIKKKDLGKPENTTSEKKARVRMEPQLKDSDARVGLDVDIRSKEMREVKKPHEELTLRVNVNKFWQTNNEAQAVEITKSEWGKTKNTTEAIQTDRPWNSSKGLLRGTLATICCNYLVV